MTYASEVLADSPVVFFEFNETSGNATDTTRGIVATNSGGVAYDSSGPNGARAASFSGANALTFSGMPPIMGGDYTQEAWINPAASQVSNIATFLRVEDGSGKQAIWRFSQTNSAHVGRLYSYASGARFASTGYYAQPGWLHVVNVVSGNSSTFYVNGIKVGIIPISEGRTIGAEGSGATAAIGATPGLAEFFTGKIARPAMYATALSQTRIMAHYAAGVALSVGSSTNYDAVVAVDSPWGYWRCNEASGTTLADSSGNGRNATLSAAADRYQTPGIVGSGIDVTGQYVTLPATASGLSGGSVSVEMLVTPTSLYGGTPTDFFGFGGETRFARHSDSGQPFGVIQTMLGTGAKNTSPPVVQNGQPAHLVWTYNSSTGATVLYRDGVAVHSFTSPTGGFNFSGTTRLLWAQYGGRELHGRVQRLAVYNSAISGARVAAHYAAATAPTGGPLPIAGTLAATLPPLGASLTGTVSVPPASGSLAATLPPLSGALTGTVSAPPIVGTLDGTLPALTGTLAGTSLPPGSTTGSLSAVLPALSASLDGFSEIPPTVPQRVRLGVGLILGSSAVTEVIAPVEDGDASAPLHVITPTVPAPTLTQGRPL